MPGAEKKWGPLEERDLAMAVILTQHGERPKYDWVRIQEMMEAWGYTFSRDAITQRWSKKIMKDFKERHGADAVKSGGPPNSAATTPQKATPRKRTAKPKVVKDEDDSDSEKKVKPASAKKRKLAKESDDDSDRETQKAAPGDMDFDSGV